MGKLGINGHVGTHDFGGPYTELPHEQSARYVELGDTIELTVTNKTCADHPFHLHGFSVQPIELAVDPDPQNCPTPTGAGTFEYAPEFVDNITVPADRTLTFRVRFDDRPMMDGATPGGGLGRWVFHCHMFFHAVYGMVSEVVVLAPDGNERPHVNTDATSVAVDEGQVAEMTGTYLDPEGGPVDLTASSGEITDNGDGTWHWSRATTDGPDESETVFVTVTDDHDQADQVAFDLTVANLPPTITITSPGDGAELDIGDPIDVDATVSDPGSGDLLACQFGWGAGIADTFANPVGSVCSSTAVIGSAGERTLTATVRDGDGAEASDTILCELLAATPPAKPADPVNRRPTYTR